MTHNLRHMREDAVRNIETRENTMKRIALGLMVTVAALLIAGPAPAYNGSYVPGVGINSTPHDLGTAHNGMNYTAQPADSLSRICIFCHAPHNSYKLSVANGGPPGGQGGSAPQALDEFTYLPLWNHTLPTSLPTYMMYNNGPGAPQTGAKASQAMQQGATAPGGVSLLCLSCHDGSIAVNSYGNLASQPSKSVSTGNTFMASAYQIGTNAGGTSWLQNHHPIGFNYDQVQAQDPEVRSADVAMLTPTTFVRDHLFATSGGGSNTNMECASCHSVHNTGNTGESLLWRSDQNSELCLTCHAKGIYTAP